MSLKSIKRRIRKVLIANRGEVALRIMWTVRELGLDSVIVYEKPDSGAYYLRIAKETVMIGETPGSGYLDIGKLIHTARARGADAIHPGYGFLSENPEFANACENAGISFIGPPHNVLRKLGAKVVAREIMRRAGIPVIPGTYDLTPGEEGVRQAEEFARRHGFPVMVKASGGGGGRGIRKVQKKEELAHQIRIARAEARKAFHNEKVYLEKCIEHPRHIEIQILADYHGNILTLGSRDCSIQRRHQKMLEIAPANLPAETLAAMYEVAVRAARQVGYVNAGTVEFLVDAATNEFWFMEVNARLQVEHTVTEELLNIDLVREQIRIAEGKRLAIPAERIRFHGKAVQVRVNAEDPFRNFLPEGGKTIELYLPPGGPGIRLDGVIYQGYRIPVEYDSLLVKMTVRGFDWRQTVERLRRALDLFLIVGPKTTIPFYRSLISEADFLAERLNTDYISSHPEIFSYPPPARELENIEQFLSHAHTPMIFPYVY
jgi:acetyl/propionyl-CoA carboxylase alpha subunit